MLNLAAILEDSARSCPDHTALVAEDTRLTYAELDAAANQVAHLLVDCGVQQGDSVALSAPNLSWFPIVYYGILKVGAVVVPLNILLTGREVAYHLNDSAARVYFCFEGTDELPMATAGKTGFDQADHCTHMFVMTADRAAPTPVAGTTTLQQALSAYPTTFESAPTEATDTAVVLYTSGTTGQPKGAELTHANLTLNTLTSHRILGGGERTDTHLIALPLFHSFGQTLQMHTAFAGGNTAVLMSRFDPAEAITLMLSEKVTHFAGVPTMYHGLLAAQPDDAATTAIASTLTLAVSAGAAMPAQIMTEVREKFGVRILEGYGLSETSPGVCFTPTHGENRPGSIGKPIWGVQMKLINPDWTEVPDDPDAIGEIAIKGHPVMKGYLHRPEATAEAIRAGWFRTGDLARRDADGYYYVIDRVKEMIIRGGYNVYPRELEEIMMTHPAVSLVAVLGVPDDKSGEEIVAVVVKNSGDATTETELLTWCKQQFAKYKYPRRIEFVDQLPMTATGKIRKRGLRP